MSQRDDLPSVIASTAVLLAVLVGSFVLAATQLTGNDSTSAESLPPVTSRAVPGFACQQPDECRVPSEALTKAYNDPAACDGSGKRVCLVPMGEVPKDLVDAIVAHYRRQYGLTVNVVKPISLPTGFERDTQLEESKLYSYLLNAFPKYANDRSITLIGILPVDVFIVGQPPGAWGFGRLHSEQRTTAPGGTDFRHGILSTWRLDPANTGSSNVRLRDERVIKLLSRYIGLAYYDLQFSNDPSSILFPRLASLDDLDRLNEHLPVP